VKPTRKKAGKGMDKRIEEARAMRRSKNTFYGI